MINKIKSFRRRKITIVILLIVALAVIIPVLYLIHNSSIALALNSSVKIYNVWIGLTFISRIVVRYMLPKV